MTLTTRGQVALVSAGILLGLTAGATAQHWDPYARHLDACRTVDLPEDVDGTHSDPAARLIAAGWFGDPTDHAERLYSPGCPTKRSGESANQVIAR